MPRLKPASRKEALLPLLEWFGSFIFLPTRLRPRSDPHFSHIQNILWVNVWGHGDLVLATPALASLRQAFPNAKITILIQPHTLPLIEHSPYIDKVITARVPWSHQTGKYNPKKYFTRELFNLICELRRNHFDLAIDGHMDIRNNALLFLTGSRRRLGFSYRGGQFLLTDAVVPDLSSPHHADLMLQLAKHLGGPQGPVRPRVVVSTEDSKFADIFWRDHDLGGHGLVVGVHPGAGHPVRYWGLEKFAAVADALARKYPVKFLCFIQPDGYGKNFPLIFPHVEVSASLSQYLALVSRCDLLLCNDGGPMHIATAVGTPVVAVFGATEPKWWSPKGPNNELVILDDFPCRPCFDHCKFDEPYCLTRLSVESVVLAAQRQIELLLAQGERKTDFAEKLHQD